jgi:ABC-type sugar transport system permease subunit
VIAGYMLKWMFSDNSGIINYLLLSMGMG